MKFARKNPLTDKGVPRPIRRSALPADMTASGRPMEAETRAFFERRFDHDFSRVRVHADAAAASSAQSAEAAAYTVGIDIVFGAGMYRPDSQAGTRLLAHELAHVVQQSKSGGATARGAAYESEAGAASDRIAAGERPSVTLAAPTAMQRQPRSGTAPSTDLTEGASPFLAAAIGSVTLDAFDTGKAAVSADNRTKLARTADTMMKLFRQYPASTVRVIGYTDAVGEEGDNQVLGQSRADAVQAALLEMGVAEAAIHSESHGASEPVVRSAKSEPRNRRVEVRFEASRLLHSAFSQGLTLTPPTARPDKSQRGVPGIGDLCLTNPTLCYGKGQGSPGGPPTVPPAALQPIPDDTPFELMDVQGVNESFTSHGVSPREGGDLRATWARLFWKYRHEGLSKELAAKAANLELSSTTGKDQGRDNPNPADRLDKDMERAYPGATKVGPASVTLFRF